ncbi:MAG: ABC transporter substrate-binding protein [Planctomycetota bacterium]|jgi:NitT/TauT family transport system substrate-binding protein|nr:ABC transporter substrate-binding protein [Planctomycetota bacterium]
MKNFLLTAAAIFLAVISTAPAADGAQKLRIGHLNSTAHLLAFVAAEEGFFAEEGLDAELFLLASANDLASGLESNKLDIAFIGSVPAVTFQSKKRDLTIFGGAMTNGHGYVIKAEFLKGGEKRDIALFKGRNVASVKNSVQDYELLVLIAQAGLEFTVNEPDKVAPDKVNIVYFDSQRDAFNALQNKQIAGVSVYSPYASIAKNAGHEVIYYCNEEAVFADQPCCRQVAFTPALKKNPALYEAAERAFIKAYKFSQENHAKTVADVKKYIDIAAKDIDYEVYGGHSTSSPDPDKKATLALKEGVVKFGYTTDYDIEPLYNTTIYEKALTALLAKNPDDKIYLALKKHFDEKE